MSTDDAEDQKRKRVPACQRDTRKSTSSRPDLSLMPPKEIVILSATVSGSLNRFEAERHGDHCLNSTISTLKHVYGISFLGEWETVPTRFGRTTRVKRYRLHPDSAEAADALLAPWFGGRP